MDYDPSGLLTLVRDPVGAATRLDYDTHGRPKSLTDSNDNVTRWTYDPAGRLLSEVDSLGQPATMAYDQQGQLVEQVNRRGQSTALSYDDKGNLSQFNLAGSPATFGYDTYGRAAGMSNPDSDFAFVLTPEGLIERVTDRKAGIAVAYEYDQAGRRMSMTAGDETVLYAYDTHGRLSSIESSAGRIGFEYDAFGRRAAMQYPNGVRTTYRYDKLNQINEIRAVGTDGTDVSRFRYTYDNLGNRTQMIDGEDRVVNYTYDAANRLVRVAESDKVTEYVYDAVGNRIAVLVNGEREDYVTGKDNRLLKAGKAEYEYDADGNMTVRTTADGKRYAYRYDAANRLIEAKGPEGTVSYAYAPNGARVSRTEAGEATRFVFDQEDMVFELMGEKIAARYLHGPGIDEPLALTRDASTAYYHADGLGSITGLTDAKGSHAARYTYDAFGKPMQDESRMVNPYRYTAREWDSKANSYFYRARFYLPEVGRFTAIDPLGLSQGQNQYVYVFNNPTGYVDPSGAVAWFVAPAVGALVGGAIGGGTYIYQSIDWSEFVPSSPIGWGALLVVPGMYTAVYASQHVKDTFNGGDLALYTTGGAAAGAAAPVGWAIAAGAGITGLGAAAIAGGMAVLGGLIDTGMQAVADDRALTWGDLVVSGATSLLGFGMGEGLKAMGLITKEVGRNATHLTSLLCGQQTQRTLYNTILSTSITKPIKEVVKTIVKDPISDTVNGWFSGTTNSDETPEPSNMPPPAPGDENRSNITFPGKPGGQNNTTKAHGRKLEKYGR